MFLSQRPHYTEEISKRSCNPTVKSTVHTNPSRKRSFILRLGLPSTLIRQENAAFFLRLSLPSTLIRHENEALFYG